MGITIVSIIVGIVFGGLCSFVVKAVAKKSSIVLLVLNCIFGALGAVAANQLLVYGPIILGLSIVPTIVGAIVLSIVVTYAYLKVSTRAVASR